MAGKLMTWTMIPALTVIAACDSGSLPEEPPVGAPALRDGWDYVAASGSVGKCVPTYILVHGWMQKHEPHWKLDYLASEILWRLGSESSFFDDANIVFWYWESRALSEWSPINPFPWRAPFDATSDEGKKLADEIRQRMSDGEINPDPESVHIIGHSFGGYVGGAAGSTFQLLGDDPDEARLGQLTALDVPEPLVRTWGDPEIDDGAFRVVDWYPVTEDTSVEGLIYSVKLKDNNPPNVINVAVSGGVRHTTIVDWYRKNYVTPDKPWISWVAPRVYRSPDAIVVDAPAGVFGYHLSAQGTVGWPDSHPAPVAEASAEGETLVIPVETGGEAGGDISSPSREYDLSVQSGEFPGVRSASLLGSAFCANIPWFPQWFSHIAHTRVSWRIDAGVMERQIGTASAESHVEMTVPVRIDGDDCWDEFPIAVVWRSALQTTAAGSNVTCNMAIASTEGELYPPYAHTRQSDGAEEKRTMFFPPSHNGDIITLRLALDLGAADRGWAEAVVEVDAYSCNAYALPSLGGPVGDDVRWGVVTPPCPILLVTLIDTMDPTSFGSNAPTVNWERVVGPEVEFERLWGQQAPTGFTPDEPGLYVLRVTITSNTGGGTAAVLRRIVVTGDIN